MAKHRTRTVSTLWQGRKRVSYIRMSGQWLEHLGFATGSTFEVQAERGRLVLEVREPDVNAGNGRGSPDTKAPKGARRGR